MEVTRSAIPSWARTAEGEVNGRWVTECKGDPELGLPAGTMVSDPAPNGEDSDTFTASNGKRYWDIPSGGRFTPRA